MLDAMDAAEDQHWRRTFYDPDKWLWLVPVVTLIFAIMGLFVFLFLW